MKTMKYALALALGVIALVGPRTVRADDVVSIALTNLVFNNSSFCNLPCMETFTAAPFQYDSTTNTVVPGTMSAPVVSGFLDPESFSFSKPNTFPILSGTQTDFTWNGSAGDSIDVLFEYHTELLPGNITHEGGVVSCFSKSCLNAAGAMPPDSFPSLISGTITVTTVPVTPIPEPSTLLLLSTGLAGMVGAARRKWLAKTSRYHHLSGR